MSALETYLRELAAIRPVGVKETSYYPALSNLFNEIGRTLKPRVRCVIHPSSSGAGLPDGGFFTPDQLRGASDADLIVKVPPSRGVIEAKGTGENADTIAHSPQVAKYLERYGQVLVTTLRDFVLVGKDANGRAAILERYALAPNEVAFWNAAARAHETAEAQGERFAEYVKRVMLHAASLTRPQDVAWFLASYARDARARLDGTELPALAGIRTAMEDGLGLRFEGAKGDHFFLSTFLQTLFYGIFSAWVLWHNEHPTRTEPFRWRDAELYLRVPVIAALFEQLSMHSRLRSLGLLDVLDWTAATLNRVDRAAFFDHFEEEHAVQYFYEPFLEAFDPELRRELGVWYTPPEIVRYMVARVDTVLREELGIADGFADERVIVLDPCCGTGAYLTEVIRHIAATLDTEGGDALAAHDLKQAAMTRVFGFEILPAPFVVAHLQLGLLLQRLGAPLSDRPLSDGSHERAGVYLTNALTGWEPPTGSKQQILGLPEMEQERDAAAHIKRTAPILVILGNPPYNAFAGISPQEERGLAEPYKVGLISEWGIKKFNLDDLYIRFFRLAERRIAETTGKGIVCYISNHSWLSDPSFVVLRKHLLASFDHFWIENMHGNRKISEYAPDGRTSETVFAMPGFSAGIQQGVAISLWVKDGKEQREPKVLFRDDLSAARAVDRRAQLLDSLESSNFDSLYLTANPDNSNRYSFRPSNVAADYLSWPRLIDFASRQPFAGLAEDRRKSLIGTDPAAIEARMRMYFDADVTWDTLSQLGTCLTTDVPRFDAKEARKLLLDAESYSPSRLTTYTMRPFDVQWCYYSPVRPLWREPRPEYWNSYEIGTPALISRFKAAKSQEGPPIAFARGLCDYHMMPPNASVFPISLRQVPPKKGKGDAQQSALFGVSEVSGPESKANLSATTRAYLAALGITNPDVDAETAGLIWMHALAIGYSPAYLTENADGIRQDWPRVPLPDNRNALFASAALGRQIAALLDTETDVPGVTKGSIRADLRLIGPIHHIEGRQLRPEAGELDVTAGWGHGGKGGVTMPGRGKAMEREYTPLELAAFAEGATALDMTLDDALACLGETTRDVYMNGVAYWANVPAKVWEYAIGGYQVMKKWLSYRERALLGRSLTVEEVREVTHMARRIAAILLLAPALDANYRAAMQG